MASPQVAGAIALMYAIDNNMSPSTVNSYLQAGYLTDDIGASGYDTSFGYGRLNVAKAIENTLSNIGDTTTTFFSADASYLNFGDSTTQLSITLSKVGNASLSVTSLSADDASGLSYSSSVDSNGAGTYTIYIDRSEVPNGAFQNRLYFNLSNSSQVSVSLYYEVGGARSRANMGKVFIGLYNSDDSLAASGESGNGWYLYHLSQMILLTESITFWCHLTMMMMGMCVTMASFAHGIQILKALKPLLLVGLIFPVERYILTRSSGLGVLMLQAT